MNQADQGSVCVSNTLIQILKNASQAAHGRIRRLAGGAPRFCIKLLGVADVGQDGRNLFTKVVSESLLRRNRFAGLVCSLALAFQHEHQIGIEPQQLTEEVWVRELRSFQKRKQLRVARANLDAVIVPMHSFHGNFFRDPVRGERQRMIAVQIKDVGIEFCETTLADSGADVLRQIKTGGHLEVILMDCPMPELDGYETTRLLRSGGNRTPIIALTASVVKEERARYFAVGVDNYLSTNPAVRAIVTSAP